MILMEFLVRTDRAIRAEAVEQRAHDVFRLRGKVWVEWQARIGNIVVDADGEMIFWRGRFQIIEDRLDHRRV